MSGEVVWVCTDCHMTMANGAPSDDPGYEPDREPLSKLRDTKRADPGMHWEEHAADCPNHQARFWVTECDCEWQPFSKAPCDGCGSQLAGSRHAVTVEWLN